MTKAKKRPKAGTSKAEAAKRRALFVEAYIANGGNATEAAKTAGYSAKTAYSAGGRLLKDVEVAAALQKRAEAVAAKFQLTTERVLQEVARLSYFDPRKLSNPDGSLKAVHELDDDTAAAVASVEFDEIKAEGCVIGMTRKVRAWDKNAALEKAMKHLGLYEKDNDQLGTAVARVFRIPAKQAHGSR